MARACALLASLTLAGLLALAAAQHEGHGGASAGPAGPGGPPINSTCVTDPIAEECADWRYPHPNAVADINSLCKAMHFMAACSVSKACNASGAGPYVNATAAELTANISRANPDICRPFQHVATVCRLDTGMSRMKGCTNFNTMCVNGSRVQMCDTANVTGLTALPTTRTINGHVQALCAANSSRAGCAECRPSFAANKTWGDCDLLVSYSQLCIEDGSAEECKDFKAMCEEDDSLWVCAGADAAKTAGGAAKAAAGKATSAAATAVAAQLLAAALAAIAALLCV